jgi:hypothetical protein
VEKSAFEKLKLFSGISKNLEKQRIIDKIEKVVMTK